MFPSYIERYHKFKKLLIESEVNHDHTICKGFHERGSQHRQKSR